MSLTAGQCRAARALIGWSQDQLSQASKVAKATIASFEAALRYPQQRTLDEIQKALEEAGIEFTNGGQPGVRLKPQSMKGQTMLSTLESLQIVSSSDLSVRLRTFDGEFPVNVVVERSAIDDRFGLSASTKQLRRDIVAANLETIAKIAAERHRRRMWSEGQSNWGGRYRQIVLRLNDLRAIRSCPNWWCRSDGASRSQARSP